MQLFISDNNNECKYSSLGTTMGAHIQIWLQWVHIFRSGYNGCTYSDMVTMGAHIQIWLQWVHIFTQKIIILNDGRQAKRKPTHKSRRSCIKMQNKLCRQGISEDMRLICFVEIMLTNTCVMNFFSNSCNSSTHVCTHIFQIKAHCV